jgi:hypothetical protein
VVINSNSREHSKIFIINTETYEKARKDGKGHGKSKLEVK